MHEPEPQQRYTLEELEALSGVARRTIRYYIQLGLVERPIGETRAAYYTWQHLSDLLTVRRLTDHGLSLEAVRDRMRAQTADPAMEVAAPQPGSLRLHSHLQLAPGVSLVIDHDAAGLSGEQVRHVARRVLAALQPVDPDPADSL